MTPEQRKKHNEEIRARYKAGDSLRSFQPILSFFPPRPIIQKDPKELKRIYGESK